MSVATPADMTRAMASACGHRRARSRTSFLSRVVTAASPRDFGGLGTPRIDPRVDDASVGKVDHPVGDVLDGGVVGDDGDGRAELLIDGSEGLEHADAGLAV